MRFQQLLNHHSHSRPSRVLFLPINRAILAERFGQFFGNCNQLGVLVEILDRLGLRQCVIECKLVSGQTKFLSLLACCGYILCQLHQFLNDLFICQHTVQICVHSPLDNLGEFFRLDDVCPAVNVNLLCNQLFQQFNGKILLFHFRHFFQEFRVEQRKFLVNIGEQIDNTVALDTMLQQLIDSGVHFGERNLLAAALIRKAHHKHTHRFKKCSFKAQGFLDKR